MSIEAVGRSDTLVLFGATGDLARKKIFPALLSMVERGHLDVPVIGVAKAGYSLEELRTHVRESLEERGGGVEPAAVGRLLGLLRFVDGDYRDEGTWTALRAALGRRARPLHYLGPSSRACSRPSSRASAAWEPWVRAGWSSRSPSGGTSPPLAR